ncbi:MAG: CHAT domain-containing protein [Alphaproteobacteria bacterium]|nr:CHAT domain-containing protein [Alphaproteobacteria bacterium]
MNAFRTTWRNKLARILLWLAVASAPTTARAQLADQFQCVDLTPIFYSDAHRTAVRALQDKPVFVAAEAQLPTMTAVVEEVRRRYGDASIAVLVASVDLARLQAAANKRQALASNLKNVLDVRRGTQAGDQEAVALAAERLALAHCLQSASSDLSVSQQLAAVERAFEVHRDAFGTSPKQRGLLFLAMRLAERAGYQGDPATLEKYGRRLLAFATRYDFLEDVDYAQGALLELLRKQPARQGEAMALAKAVAAQQARARDVGPKFGSRSIDGALTIFFDARDIDSYYALESLKFARQLEPGTFGTEYIAVHWIFLHALRVREREPEKFFPTIGRITEVREGECKRSHRVFCTLDLGRELEQLGLVDLAWEYARAAKEFADATAGLPEEERSRVNQELAAYERRAGFVGRAIRLEAETHGQAFTPATFDPEALGEKVGLIAALRGSIAFMSMSQKGPDGEPYTQLFKVRDFIARNMEFLYSRDELFADREILESALSRRMKEELARNIGNTSAYITGLILHEGAKYFSSALKREAADTVRADVLARSNNLAEQFFPRRDEFYVESMALLYDRLFNAYRTGYAEFAILLYSSDETRRAEAFRLLIRKKIDEGMGLGQSGDISFYAAEIYQAYLVTQAMGDRGLARLFAQEWFARVREEVGATAPEFHQRHIQQALPMLVWLGADALRAGRRVDAVRFLDEADGLSRSRITREWRSGNVAAASTLASLRSHLRRAADVRAALATTGTPQEQARAREAAFEAAQLPHITDAALAVLAQAQQRLLESDGSQSRQALSTREDIEVALRRIAALRAAFIAYVSDEEAERASRLLRNREPQLRSGAGPNSDIAAVTPVGSKSASVQLRSNELLLTTVSADEATVVVAMTQAKMSIRRAPLSKASLAEAVASLRAGVEIQDGMLPPFPYQVAAKLFEDLFGGFKTDILSAKHLYFVPDGPLLSLPLHLLLTEKVSAPEGASAIRSANLPWLLLGPAISILPSVQSLAALRRMPASAAQEAFLGIGDPLLKGAASAKRGVAATEILDKSGRVSLAALSQLSQLPDSKIELLSMAKAMDSKSEDLLLQQGATETGIRRLSLDRYRVIAFATHGLLAGELDGLVEPALVLTPPQTASRSDDGVLMASEIAALKLDAEVVILSACNTAGSDGKPQAEGLSGLARAFIAAGARRVVASHWSVSSDSASLLMSEMIRQSRANRLSNWSEAHRVAMVKLSREAGPPEYAHPAHWAPFVVIGTP